MNFVSIFGLDLANMASKMAESEGDCKLFVSQDLEAFCSLIEVRRSRNT